MVYWAPTTVSAVGTLGEARHNYRVGRLFTDGRQWGRQCKPGLFSSAPPPNASRMRAIRPILVVALLFTWAPAGHAMDSCDGAYSASRLRPLPTSIALKLDRHDDSARADQLAKAFLAGVTAAGVTVRENPTVLLHLNVDISHPPLPRPPATDSLRPDLRRLQGAIFLTLPETDPNRYAPPVHPGGPPVLSIRTQLTDSRAGTVLWIGNFSCAMRSSSSDEHLARDMGRVIGSALGRTATRVPF